MRFFLGFFKNALRLWNICSHSVSKNGKKIYWNTMEEIKKNTPRKITFYEFNRRSSCSSLSGSYCWSFGENKMMCRFFNDALCQHVDIIQDSSGWRTFTILKRSDNFNIWSQSATSNQIQLPSIQFLIFFVPYASIDITHRINILLL